MHIVFIGAGEIGVPTLRAFLRSSEHHLAGVVTQPDKPVGRSQRIEPPPIKKALAGCKVAILQPARIKDRQAIEAIQALVPDAIVVMAYGQILPREVLEIPSITCLNLHASLLPRWRGAAPIQAAIAAGDRETGITVMYMAEELDTGDILLQRKTDISPTDTGGSLNVKLAQIAPAALLDSLKLLASGTAPRIPQDNALATYAPKLTRADGKIDWSEPAEAIARKIRAFKPWPGSFALATEKSGRTLRLKVFDAQIVKAKGRPGEVVRADNQGLIIGTGKNALSLGHLQLEGKWRMSAYDFVRGHAGLLGHKLK